MRLKYIIYVCLSIFVFYILLNYNSNKEGLKNDYDKEDLINDSDKTHVKKLLKKIRKHKKIIGKNEKKITILNKSIEEMKTTVNQVMQTMGGAKDQFDSVSDASSDMNCDDYDESDDSDDNTEYDIDNEYL